VADRFHLLKNLTDAVTSVLTQHGPNPTLILLANARWWGAPFPGANFRHPMGQPNGVYARLVRSSGDQNGQLLIRQQYRCCLYPSLADHTPQQAHFLQGIYPQTDTCVGLIDMP
jgi:hypothetical protein